MKKIISLVAIVSGLFVSSTLTVSAQYAYPQYNYTNNMYVPAAYNTNTTYTSYNTNTYTPYYNNYVNAPTSNSYTYTQGCYIYQYDAYTRITSLIGSNCTTNTYTYPTLNYYTQPSYQTYYTLPTYSYSYVLPTYQYTPTPRYNDGRKRHHGYGYNNNCTWQNGYQVCY